MRLGIAKQYFDSGLPYDIMVKFGVLHTSVFESVWITVEAVNGAGAIDGILIWMHKPSLKEADAAGVGQKKFFCGQKNKFGLNCQAVCDV